MESIDDKIIMKMRKAGRGSLFFPDDFLIFGSLKAVNKALERLAQEGDILRIARGIYTRLEKDPILGPIKPGTEEIAEALRRRDKARVIPTGDLALNAIGLSSQVPMNVVFLTDGSARTITVGKRKIVFKKAAPKNFATIGELSGTAIQAMKAIGKDNLSSVQEHVIIEYLIQEDPYRLEHDIRFAPEWIRIIMRKALKRTK